MGEEMILSLAQPQAENNQENKGVSFGYSQNQQIHVF